MMQDDKDKYNTLTRGITQAYLLRLNQYALDNGLISECAYRKMDTAIRISYDATLARIKHPPEE